ncbi:hypothetical protein AB0H71_19910 [Nocardia sp. NPDC050697]
MSTDPAIRVLLVAGRYQVRVPPPFVVGSEFAGWSRSGAAASRPGSG